MAFEVHCADTGADCDFAARADTMEELMELVSDHARRTHGMEEMDAETESKLREVVREV